MTEAVRTEGFNVPGAGANIQPSNMQPGIVVPPAAPVIPPIADATPTSTATPAPNEGALASAIAALTAALGKPAEPVTTENAAPTSADLNSYDVNGIDDPIIRSMATVLQATGKGLDLNRALGNAIERGDPELVDTAYLREAGGANAEQLVTIAKGIVNAIEAKSAEVTNKVYSLAGGEAQWDTSTAAFNQAAPSELKLVVKQMLDSKRPDLIEAGAKIVVEFGKSSGMIPKTSPSVQTGAASMPAAMALDKFQFQEELRKLRTDDRQYVQKRDELFARRQLGKRIGK